MSFPVLASASHHQGLRLEPGLVQAGQGLSVGRPLQTGAVYREDIIPPLNGTFRSSHPRHEHTMDLQDM